MSDPISSKEKVLKKLRKSLLQKDIFFNPDLDFDSDVFIREDLSLLESFARNIREANGFLIQSKNTYQFLDQFFSLAEKRGWQEIVCLEENLQTMLKGCEFPFALKTEAALSAEVGLTGCEALVARTGSILLSSKNNLSRTISAYPPIHIVVAYRNQLIYGLKEFFQKNDGAQSSAWSIITGPSRTSDIERTLVLGAHGPKELIVFLIDEDMTGQTPDIKLQNPK